LETDKAALTVAFSIQKLWRFIQSFFCFLTRINV